MSHSRGFNRDARLKPGAFRTRTLVTSDTEIVIGTSNLKAVTSEMAANPF